MPKPFVRVTQGLQSFDADPARIHVSFYERDAKHGQIVSVGVNQHGHLIVSSKYKLEFERMEQPTGDGDDYRAPLVRDAATATPYVWVVQGFDKDFNADPARILIEFHADSDGQGQLVWANVTDGQLFISSRSKLEFERQVWTPGAGDYYRAPFA